LVEAAISHWIEKGSFSYGNEWMDRFIKELVDGVEGRLAKKVYTVRSKVLDKARARGTIFGNMKLSVGEFPFEINVYVAVKSGSRTGAHTTRISMTAGEGHIPIEKVFRNTAAPGTIVKWIMRQLNERRY
jgi:hypothetical protein